VFDRVAEELSCAVEVMQYGQPIPHSIARGGILRIVPPKKEEAKVASRRIRRNSLWRVAQ